LTCTRVEPTQVDCYQEESWLKLVPLGKTRPIRDLEEAEADLRRSSNPRKHQLSSYSFHLILRTEAGSVSAIEYFTFPQAQDMARQINSFIANTQADWLQVDNFNWLSTSLGMVGTVLPCAILSIFTLTRYFGKK
jgi:hypothetical protein